MTKKSVGNTAKSTVIWSVIGLAFTLLMSLAGGWIAMKTADPLKMISPIAIACTGLGALCAAFGAGKKGGIGAGFGAGGVYMLILLAASLWGEGGEASPYLLLAATLAGTAAGAILSVRRKPSAHKRIKRLAAAHR